LVLNSAPDGSFTGFIKVHLRLSRPVTVVEALGSEGCRGGTDCDSATTTREVIQGLLKKFMVLDNPGKFALYRQAHRDGQDLFQKLPLCECPLLLRLLAGPDPQLLRFVLKEKETGEWHAFSVPELQNFLMILEKEEAERVRAVEEKYSLHRQKLQQAIEQYDS
uniref:Ras association domain family member 5 n=1 Tax=Mola mola TaxID=94237 RepID=A0A3Q4ANK1_MOLML